MLTDKVPLNRLIITAAITIPTEDPRCSPHTPVITSMRRTIATTQPALHPTKLSTRLQPSALKSQRSGGPWNASALARLRPGASMWANMQNPQDRKCLRDWLRYADTIIGQNLPFDISYLRADPEFRSVLDGRHTLIDVSVANYLQCEANLERSLKDIGPALLLYQYDPELTLKHGFRFPTPRWLHPAKKKGVLHYNCEDSHNSLLCMAEYAALILRDHASTDKLSPFCVKHYSELLWLVIRLGEAGVPMHRQSIIDLENSCYKTIEKSDAVLASAGVQLEGKDSRKTQLAFLTEVFNYLDQHADIQTILGVPTVFESKIIGYTETTKELQCSSLNRRLAIALLETIPSPQADDYKATLTAWQERETANKTISSETYPVLRHKRSAKAKNPKASILLPHPVTAPGVQVTFPKWYCVPSAFKDGGGGEGGQRQARFSASDPGLTKFSEHFKSCIHSRFIDGTIAYFDLALIEMRVPGVLSGEPTLIEGFAQNHDLHSRRALALMGEDNIFKKYPELKGQSPEKWKYLKAFNDEERQAYKRVNFADGYWSGPPTMQQSVLEDTGRILPLSLFQQAANTRSETRPTLYKWQQGQLVYASEHNELVLPFTGHSRSFLGGTSANKPNEMINFPVQSIAAIVLQRILAVLCDPDFPHHIPQLNTPNPPCYLIANWYDAGWFDCRRHYIPRLRDGIAAAVEYVEHSEYWHWWCTLTGNRVPLSYEFKVVPFKPPAKKG